MHPEYSADGKEVWISQGSLLPYLPPRGRRAMVEARGQAALVVQPALAVKGNLLGCISRLIRMGKDVLIALGQQRLRHQAVADQRTAHGAERQIGFGRRIAKG